MKKRNIIKAEVENTISPNMIFLNYVTRFSKDLDYELFLSTDAHVMLNKAYPVAITGSNDFSPVKTVQLETIKFKHEMMKVIVEKLRTDYNQIQFGLNTEMNNHNKVIPEESLFLSCVEIENDPSWMNVYFGTNETQFIKTAKHPVLGIPSKVKYKRPKKLLIVANNVMDYDFTQIFSFCKKIGIHPIIAFEEFNEFVKSYNSILNNNIIPKVTLLQYEKDSGFRKLIDEENSDWVSFLNFDKDGFSRIFSESTNKLILSTQKPILTF